MESHFVYVEANSPDRCQGLDKINQCMFQVVKGEKFCPRHLGRYSTKEKRELRNFRLQRWQQRVNEFADNDQVKSLREEIGITRLLLEEQLNKCESSHELLIHSTKIVELINKIQGLVVACHKLELSTNQLLGRSTILAIGEMVVNVITQHIEDPVLLDKISEGVFNGIETTLGKVDIEGTEQESSENLLSMG